ncbi:MAG TPA: MlaA family lipoprotein [Moraxellaceae bacterium]|nr:MlaA family lipoprotein [Moraxellaceae bacterium]
MAMRHRGLVLALCLLATPVLAEESVPAVPAPVKPAAPNPDPWEGFNRRVFRFNDTLDRYALKPVAKGYRAVTPRPLRAGITNFFRNLKMPVVMLNDLLQGKVRAAGQDLSRFVVNSTLGFVGFVDASTVLGIPLNDEDFGQTLGKWGVASGPYVVLPFFGPSTIRDGVGTGVDFMSDPITLQFNEGERVTLWAGRVVNTRANLIDVEDIIQGDRYLFVRDLYLQSRAFDIKDGRVDSDPFLDDDSSGAPADDAAPATPEGAPAPATDSSTAPATDNSAAPTAGSEPSSSAPESATPTPDAGSAPTTTTESPAVQDGHSPEAGVPAIDKSTESLHQQ